MTNPQDPFQLTDIGDLPAELVKHLRATKRDQFESRLMELLRMANRDLSLDELLVGYYRQYAEVVERRPLINKLYAMSKGSCPSVEPVPDKKAVYRLRQGAAPAASQNSSSATSQIDDLW